MPLRLGGEVCGVFIVYAGETDVFQGREVSLLQEIADSISFAMDHLDQEEKRRQAEESLLHREAQYRAVIETSADGFWMANEEGRILEVNDAYAHLSGYRREELVDMPISALEAKEQPAETAARILKIRQNGTDLFEITAPSKGRDRLARRGQCGLLAQRRRTDTGLPARYHPSQAGRGGAG